jgi:hypothetical protein
LPAIRSKTESSLSLHFSLHHESWLSLVCDQPMFSFEGLPERSRARSLLRRPTAVRVAPMSRARTAGERLDASQGLREWTKGVRRDTRLPCALICTARTPGSSRSCYRRPISNRSDQPPTASACPTASYPYALVATPKSYQPEIEHLPPPPCRGAKIFGVDRRTGILARLADRACEILG